MGRIARGQRLTCRPYRCNTVTGRRGNVRALRRVWKRRSPGRGIVYRVRRPILICRLIIPAVVIGRDGDNYDATHGGQVVKVAEQQMRLLSRDERLADDVVHQMLRDASRNHRGWGRNATRHLDLTDEDLPPFNDDDDVDPAPGPVPAPVPPPAAAAAEGPGGPAVAGRLGEDRVAPVPVEETPREKRPREEEAPSGSSSSSSSGLPPPPPSGS